MKVFTDTPITKERFMYHLKRHQKADAFIGGTYGESASEGQFKACAVGCSIQSISDEIGTRLPNNDHTLYEKYLGVPEWIAILEDTIFEGLSEERKKTFPVEFGEALNVGSNLNKIKIPLIVYILEENLNTLNSLKVDKKKDLNIFNVIKQTKAATRQMIKAQRSGNANDMNKARSAAYSARSAAYSVAYSAAYSATYSAARSAACSAYPVAYSAAYSVARSATYSAYSAVYEKYADKLIELIKECK